MLSYDEKYNGYQVARKTGTEDASVGEQIRLTYLHRNLSVSYKHYHATRHCRN